MGLHGQRRDDHGVPRHRGREPLRGLAAERRDEVRHARGGARGGGRRRQAAAAVDGEGVGVLLDLVERLQERCRTREGDVSTPPGRQYHNGTRRGAAQCVFISRPPTPSMKRLRTARASLAMS